MWGAESHCSKSPTDAQLLPGLQYKTLLLFFEALFFIFICLFLKKIILIFRKREGEKHRFVALLIHSLLGPVCALIGDRTCDLGASGRCSNPWSYPPGLVVLFF